MVVRRTSAAVSGRTGALGGVRPLSMHLRVDVSNPVTSVVDL